MSKRHLILVGGGGHCRSCIDVIEQEGRFEIAGIVAHENHPETGAVMGYPIPWMDDNLSDLKKRYDYALVTVGQIKNPEPRIRLYNLLKELNFSLPTIVSPIAYVSKHAYIGEGAIVMHHALVNAGARIGVNCIINTKALVEHDAVVEDHCHISTGAVVNGGVTVHEGCFLGSNSMCKEYIQIGSRSIVVGGGGSVKGSDFGETEHKTLKIGIFGAAGFSRETADICIAVGYEQIVFVDIGVTSESCFGFPLVEEKQVTRLHEEGYHFVIGIGDNAIRKKIYHKFSYLQYVNLVHPSVSLGRGQFQSLAVTTGNIIAAGVRFTNTIKLGNFGVYNLNCTIGHDCIINDYVNIAPGANISGNVLLKEGAYIGTNAAVLQGESIEKKISIGKFSTVGAGAVVTKDVDANTTVVGIPAKLITK